MLRERLEICAKIANKAEAFCIICKRSVCWQKDRGAPAFARVFVRASPLAIVRTFHQNGEIVHHSGGKKSRFSVDRNVCTSVAQKFSSRARS